MLVLPIKGKWFDMILAGEKKEEYRNYSPYWIKRFCNIGMLERIQGDVYKPTDTQAHVKFRNGYSSVSRAFVAEVGLSIGCGEPAWGAKPNEKYLILTVVKIVEVSGYEKDM